jgi:heat shock protein 90kDa beta
MSVSKDIRLMVKRVFITSDLGEDAMPKWASWVKVVVDGLFSILNHFHQLLTNI